MLILKWQPDNDGTGKLIIEASSSGFAGRGSAWFDPLQLKKEAEKFAQYPIPEDDPPVIQGGYWSSATRGVMDQEHLFLSVRPLGPAGDIAFLVRLASPRDEKETSSRFSVELQIATTYEQLRWFSKKLTGLINGEIAEIMTEDD